LRSAGDEERARQLRGVLRTATRGAAGIPSKESLTMTCLSKMLALTLLCGLALLPARAADKDQHGFLNRVYKDAQGKESRYVVFVYHDYNGDKPYPLILFLHSSSERGDDGERQVGPLGNAIRPQEKTFPFITVFPQSRFHWRIESEDTERALAILADVQKEFKVDEKRLYVTGISIGGWGTFGLGMKYPDRWAAIVPIAGGGDPGQAAKIKDLPCWCFQGANDSEAFVKSTRDTIAAIKEAGGNPKYTEYPDVGHNCWEKAYATPELYAWLLKQKRK
jgi:predicted peptidase